MKKLTYLSLLSLFISLFFACEDENFNKEFGQYALAINYNAKEVLELHFVINEEECGKLMPVPDVHYSYVRDCKDLKKPDMLTNVFVHKKVAPGKHTLKIKTAEGRIVKTLEFEMISKECVFQNVSISFN